MAARQQQQQQQDLVSLYPSMAPDQMGTRIPAPGDKPQPQQPGSKRPAGVDAAPEIPGGMAAAGEEGPPMEAGPPKRARNAQVRELFGGTVCRSRWCELVYVSVHARAHVRVPNSSCCLILLLWVSRVTGARAERCWCTRAGLPDERKCCIEGGGLLQEVKSLRAAAGWGRSAGNPDWLVASLWSVPCECNRCCHSCLICIAVLVQQREGSACWGIPVSTLQANPVTPLSTIQGAQAGVFVACVFVCLVSAMGVGHT
eukprot:scaffold130284_cov20-Tisochrysis_lutea.AAC.1